MLVKRIAMKVETALVPQSGYMRRSTAAQVLQDQVQGILRAVNMHTEFTLELTNSTGSFQDELDGVYETSLEALVIDALVGAPEACTLVGLDLECGCECDGVVPGDIMPAIASIPTLEHCSVRFDCRDAEDEDVARVPYVDIRGTGIVFLCAPVCEALHVNNVLADSETWAEFTAVQDLTFTAGPCRTYDFQIGATLREFTVPLAVDAMRQNYSEDFPDHAIHAEAFAGARAILSSSASTLRRAILSADSTRLMEEALAVPGLQTLVVTGVAAMDLDTEFGVKAAQIVRRVEARGASNRAEVIMMLGTTLHTRKDIRDERRAVSEVERVHVFDVCRRDPGLADEVKEVVKLMNARMYGV